MFQDKSVRASQGRYQEMNVTKYQGNPVTLFQGKSAKVFHLNNVTKSQEELKRRSAATFPDKCVTAFQGNSAPMFPDNSARVSQGRSVTLFQDNNAVQFQGNNVKQSPTRFLVRNAQMFLSKFAAMFQVNSVPMSLGSSVSRFLWNSVLLHRESMEESNQGRFLGSNTLLRPSQNYFTKRELLYYKHTNTHEHYCYTLLLYVTAYLLLFISHKPKHK